jgi:hypothetical protein
VVHPTRKKPFFGVVGCVLKNLRVFILPHNQATPPPLPPLSPTHTLRFLPGRVSTNCWRNNHIFCKPQKNFEYKFNDTSKKTSRSSSCDRFHRVK